MEHIISGLPYHQLLPSSKSSISVSENEYSSFNQRDKSSLLHLIEQNGRYWYFEGLSQQGQNDDSDPAMSLVLLVRKEKVI